MKGQKMFETRDDSIFLLDVELNEAKNVLRINEDGIMLSENGIEGPYRYLRLEGIDIEGVTKSFSGRLVPRKTHYDLLIRKTPEELAELFADNNCGYCRIHDFCFAKGCAINCEDMWLDWLKQEAGE